MDSSRLLAVLLLCVSLACADPPGRAGESTPLTPGDPTLGGSLEPLDEPADAAGAPDRAWVDDGRGPSASAELTALDLQAPRGELQPGPGELADAGAADRAPTDDRRWPSANAELTPPDLTQLTKRRRRWRVYLDAGHGAPGNEGVASVFCEAEQDFTLRVAQHLARRLEATGSFQVRLSRQRDERPGYQLRLSAAEAWRADVFLSLHSDARGYAEPWAPSPGKLCWRNDLRPGFSVLWSDEAAAPLREQRVTLARALARRMHQTGFLAYDGADYPGLYDGDPEPGVFVSRHPPGRRIFVLLRPKLPSVIIETHHALDLREATRWKELRTLDAFSDAVAAGLADFLAAPSPIGSALPR